MGRPPCCDKANVKKGPWTPEEDAKLLAFTSTHGTGNWTTVPQRAGIDHMHILICRVMMWSLIGNQLPGRTDNDVKNYWNTKLSKKLRQRGIDPITHRPIADLMHSIGALAIRPPHPNTSAAYLPLVQDVAYHAAGVLQNPQQQVVVEPASPDPHHVKQELKWSDFLVDDAAAEAQQQFHHHEAVTMAGGAQQAGAGSSAAGGGGDDGAAAFIDSILDCDKETGVDQLIAELLADPAYYAGSSSSPEMDWGY
ncbi:hypothetical protein PR202_ga26050 [Eleusine coracana subsp. coracana]|uniref:Uncharacterized protein n=1 Tax=Eleusine coracana subsp. coracana TaxID=191504 RepID=A0AAV5DDF5_ELECO|nr:hypothetical protein PR202_ga26050 [Eleusine coracana subsp. coracana]